MRVNLILLMALLISSAARAEFNREDYEESAGGSFSFLLNPEDDIYGMSFGDGTWLKGAPVFGDYQISLFSHGAEDSWYSAMAMTIRIMPRWRFAPFVGGGGSYNYSFKRQEENVLLYEENTVDDRGDSYWGGHAEAGFRIWLNNRVRLLELSARYTWTDLDGERDYWLAGITTGAGI